MTATRGKPIDNLRMLRIKVRAFAAARDWDQFHSPKNLAMALACEVGELLEHFQWLSLEASSALSPRVHLQVEKELADILIYLVRIADKLGIDLSVAARKKLIENSKKYPAARVHGSARKYTYYKRRRSRG